MLDQMQRYMSGFCLLISGTETRHTYAGADATVYVRLLFTPFWNRNQTYIIHMLEQMQQYMSGFCLLISGTETRHTYAGADATVYVWLLFSHIWNRNQTFICWSRCNGICPAFVFSHLEHKPDISCCICLKPMPGSFSMRKIFKKLGQCVSGHGTTVWAVF